MQFTESPVKVQFRPVGRARREWMWKARGDNNTITISGRFGSLQAAVRDARTHIDDRASADDGFDDGPFAA
jgi:hypothetical protein